MTNLILSVGKLQCNDKSVIIRANQLKTHLLIQINVNKTTNKDME